MNERQTILVVDDEPTVRSLMRAVLEDHGFLVLDAPNGEQAVEVYRANKAVISLAILDMIMPGMHGPEVASKFLELKPELPLLFMSGYTNTRPPAGHAFLSKPFLVDHLIATIGNLLAAGQVESSRAAGR